MSTATTQLDETTRSIRHRTRNPLHAYRFIGPRALLPTSAQRAAVPERTASLPPSADLGGSAPWVAKSGLTRSGSTLCGVVGFQQHLGLGSALLGGLGWLIASDHAGFLLRRRYGPRIQLHLRRWQPTRRLPTWLIGMLHVRAVLSGRLASTPYRVFALINTIGAVGWGAAFVWTGYVLARSWHGGQPTWSDIALLLTTTAALGIDLGLRHRAHRSRPTHHIRRPQGAEVNRGAPSATSDHHRPFVRPRRSGSAHDSAPTAPNYSG